MFELRRPELSDTGTSKPECESRLAPPTFLLPDTMMSLLFQAFTKGIRRFWRQSILGACLTSVGIALLALPLRATEESPLRLVLGIPWFIGLCQWFVSRHGIRLGQLADAVSRGTYREPRPITAANVRGTSPGRLAPWFIASILKRTIVVLGLFALVVFPSFPQYELGLWCRLVFIVAAFLVAVDAIAFAVATDTHGYPFTID
jgi:hypothetical protein